MINQAEILAQTEAYVKEKLSGEGSGHDWWHIVRVRQNAHTLCEHEPVDAFVVELAALLHDIADHKFHDGDTSVGPRLAREWLTSLGVDEVTITHICEIIADLSFKGSGVPTPMHTREGMVVQDADRLDAIGAIGIARTFAYGGHKNRVMYDPTVPPVTHDSFTAYQKSTAPTINHFYEKLLLLKERMNTPTARRMAEARHAFMEQFLTQFFDEWKGKA
jgi:uncharacterized protein